MQALVQQEMVAGLKQPLEVCGVDSGAQLVPTVCGGRWSLLNCVCTTALSSATTPASDGSCARLTVAVDASMSVP